MVSKLDGSIHSDTLFKRNKVVWCITNSYYNSFWAQEVDPQEKIKESPLITLLNFTTCLAVEWAFNLPQKKVSIDNKSVNK